jgi:CRP/FNR family transcriptional regulator, cyclic AMP receptor protein
MADIKEKLAALERGDLFQYFDRPALEQLAAIAEDVEIAKGTVLCEQGRVAQECWAVVSGEATVEVGGGQLLAVVGPGEMIGEMGLLDHLPRSATVTATTPMTLLRIDGTRFGELLDASPMALVLLQMLSRRIRELEHGRAVLR